MYRKPLKTFTWPSTKIARRSYTTKTARFQHPAGETDRKIPTTVTSFTFTLFRRQFHVRITSERLSMAVYGMGSWDMTRVIRRRRRSHDLNARERSGRVFSEEVRPRSYSSWLNQVSETVSSHIQSSVIFIRP